MKEFLYEYYSILTKVVEIIAAATGLIVYNKYKATHIKYFILFLIWVVVIEIVGSYTTYLKNRGLEELIQGTVIEKNYWWYNLFWASASTFFYAWLLSRQLKTFALKRTILYACGIYLATLIFILIFNIDNFFNGRSIPLVIGNVVVILLSSIFYLYETLNSDKLLNFYKSIYFYIAAIIFIWWLVSTPLSFFEVYNTESDWDYVVIKWTIKLACNFFMYLGFTIALIVSRPEYD